ncbi:hypothetical protein [Oceaniradius stylonematis]|uniref:hypothetical protein n=1 Tax=Oceaniradius stylonematis TaxID=2184161 RepID=UPI003B592C86
MSAVSPLATQILDAGTHAERANLLLTAPHGLLLQGGAAIFEACEAVQFGVGGDYVAAVVATLCATRAPDGALPDHHRARLEGMAQLLRQVTSLPDDALIAMQARHDARLGRENPDMVGTPAYDRAWAEMRSGKPSDRGAP